MVKRECVLTMNHKIVRWRNGNAHTTRVLQARPKSKLYGGINTGSSPVLTTKLRGGEDGILGGLITQGRRFESCLRNNKGE